MRRASAAAALVAALVAVTGSSAASESLTPPAIELEGLRSPSPGSPCCVPLNMRGRIGVERLADRPRSVALAAEPTTNDRFSATLDASQAVPKPRGVRSRARGRLVGSATTGLPNGARLWPGRATFRLTWSALSGPPTDIVIRFGRRGQTGHVWHRLCSRHAGRGGCPQRRTGSIRGTFDLPGGPSDLRIHDLYVEIATDRNAQGELRGQIAP